VSAAVSKSTPSRVLAHVVLIAAAIYTLFPLIWLFTAATKNTGDLYSTGMFQWNAFRLFDNIADLFSESNGIYLHWYLNSVLYAGGGAITGAFLSVCAGYAFEKFSFPGKERIFGVVLLGVLIPTSALALPLYLLASSTGLVNTFWAVLIPSICNPFGVYLARIFARGYIPDELLEAARVDGAGELKTFFGISWKLMLPGFATIFLFQFIGIWNNFFLPLVMLSNRNLFPVSLGLYNWNSQVALEPQYYTLVMVGAFVAIIPLIIVFIFTQKFWRAGLTAGSLK
jgi:multiple sugar transport system permease protein